MGDITAVVLTLGEETIQRALSSVAGQSLAPEETIVVANTVPFHAALNQGASQVKTAYFVQVDCDMVLDEHCFQMLRKCMAPGVGVAAGHLRDPLIGRVCCVKMFRRECFDKTQFKNSISPDTDFVKDISQYGWSLVYTLRFGDDAETLWHTFGDHSPNFTPQYAFSKHLMEGGRYRYRGDLGGLLWHLRQLRDSSHRAAPVAQIAMAHGGFSEEERDCLGSPTADPDLCLLMDFLRSEGGCDIKTLDVLPSLTGRPREMLRRFVLLGMDLRQRHSLKAFNHCMDILLGSDHALAWVARAALCHGLLTRSYDRARLEKDCQLLRELLPGESPSAMLTRGLRRLVRLLRDCWGSAGFLFEQKV
ncbi:MAG: glycosyltransferase family A protein [Anaerolineae bacterium]|jgi:hypothetical protein